MFISCPFLKYCGIMPFWMTINRRIFFLKMVLHEINSRNLKLLSRYCIFDLTDVEIHFFSDISPLLESGLLHKKRFFLFFWRFHWSDEHVVLLMRMLHWFPERGCKYGLVSSFQRCCSSSELSVCISTSLQHPGLSVFTARILYQQPNFKSISSKFTHGTNKVRHNVVDKWQQQDVSVPLNVCNKTEKAVEWIPEGWQFT